MSVHYVLDGYNIIQQTPSLAVESLRTGRESLIQFIEIHKPQGSLKNPVTIVFDGQAGIGTPREVSAVKVVFACGESADEKIKRMVGMAGNKKNMVVVTDDREIRYHVRALGAKVLWVGEFLGRDGVWTAEGLIDITLEIPNQEIRNPNKVILLEIGFRGDSELPAFSVAPIFLTPPGAPVVVRKVSQEVVEDYATGWSTLFAEWYIEPNPDAESICYSFAGDIAALDYVNVYTECVPEPMTIALLGLGGLMLRRKRKA